MKIQNRKVIGKKKLPNQKRDVLTYALFMIWPTIQFVIFYIGVNFNSMIMAFQKYDAGAFVFDPTFHAMKQMAYFFTNENGMRMVGYSFLSYIITLFINVPLGLFFSYYISKKMPLSGIFRVILFIPSILSSIVTGVIFKAFVSNALPLIVGPSFVDPFSYSASSWATYGTVMFYNVFVSFGTSVLLYSNKMSAIPTEMLEAAKLDGASGFKEFWHIVLPQTFPTLSVFVVSGFAGIFTNQIGLYSIFSQELTGNKVSSIQTLGYYLFIRGSDYNNMAEFPKLVAIGLVITLIALPLTLLLRWALNKFGPSEN